MCFCVATKAATVIVTVLLYCFFIDQVLFTVLCLLSSLLLNMNVAV